MTTATRTFIPLDATLNQAIALGRIPEESLRILRGLDRVGMRRAIAHWERTRLQRYRPNPAQWRFHASHARIVQFLTGNQVGKAQPNDTPVFTSSGWKPMGEIAVGDTVYAMDGSPCQVIGVHPQGVQSTYQLTFDGGEQTRCTADHLWTVFDSSARFRKDSSRYQARTVMALGEILERWGPEPEPKYRVSIPTCAPQTPEQLLPLSPYVLGALLGDGCFRNRGLTICNPDAHIISRIHAELPPGCSLSRSGMTRGIVGDGQSNAAIDTLRLYGLWGLGSPEKFVPEPWLRGSAEQRLDLLHGLMDTDGTCTEKGAASYTSTSVQLAEDVAYLVRSLGGKSGISRRQTHYTHKGEKRWGRPSYRVRIRLHSLPCFDFPAKKEREIEEYTRTTDRILMRIEYVGESLCTCISVDHPSGTYVAEGFIVTHNSSAAVAEGYMHMSGKYEPWWTARDFRAMTPPISMRFGIPEFRKHGRNMERRFRSIWPGWGNPSIWRTCRGNHGAIEYIRHVPTGSEAEIISYEQEPSALEGWVGDLVVLDEPCPYMHFLELWRGLVARGGIMLLPMTPTREPWMYDEFGVPPEEGMMQQRLQEEGFEGNLVEVVTGTIHENWALTAEHIAHYLAGLNDTQRATRERGEYGFIEGLIYASYLNDDHFIDIENPPDSWTRYMAIDPHEGKPHACLWLAVSPWDEVICYRELLVSNKGPHELARACWEAEYEGTERIVLRVVDASSNKETAILAYDGRMDLKNWFQAFQAAFNEQYGGYEPLIQQTNSAASIPRVQRWLSQTVRRPDGTQVPRLRFSSHLKHLTRQLKKYQLEDWRHGPLAGTFKEKPLKVDDDLVDDLHYLIAREPSYVSGGDVWAPAMEDAPDW